MQPERKHPQSFVVDSLGTGFITTQIVGKEPHAFVNSIKERKAGYRLPVWGELDADMIRTPRLQDRAFRRSLVDTQ